jgi:hypothetical protein
LVNDQLIAPYSLDSDTPRIDQNLARTCETLY